MPSASHAAIDAASSVIGVISQPTGSGISRVQDLSGSDLNTKINSTTNQVSFPAGSFTWNDFQYAATNSVSQYSGGGMKITNATALLGSGVDQTILQMNAGTTTKYADMSQSTIDLQYVDLFPQVTLVQDLTLQGVSIGDLTKLANGNAASNGSGTPSLDSPYIYNGFYLNQPNGLTFRRVKTAGIPGSDHVNPGETFHYDSYHGTNITWEDCEVDGANISGSGFGPNNATGPLTWTRCYAHDVKYSCAWALYKCQGDVTITDCSTINCRYAYNFELNYKMNVSIVRPVIDNSGSGDMFFGTNYKVGTDVSSPVSIQDPVDPDGNPLATIRIKVPATYGTNADGSAATNLQNKSDIHVYRGGVDVTSSVVQWV